MLPAEKTHYRKGLTLGLTLAETFSIVVFILLLACAALLRFEQVQRDDAEAQRDTARVDLLITQEIVRSDNMSWGNANAWFERSRELVREKELVLLRAEKAERDLASAMARADEAESQLQSAGASEEVVQRLGEQAEHMRVLEDSLARSHTEQARADARADSLAEQAAATADSMERQAAVSELLEPLGRAIEDYGGLGPEEADQVIDQAARAERLADSLSLARQTISALDRELQDAQNVLLDDAASALDSLRAARLQTDALRDRTTQVEQERDDALGRANYLQTQVEQMREGTGIDPPPCWLDRDGDPEYIFRVELTDSGTRLFHISPARRTETDLEAMRPVAAIEEGRVYDPATFLRLTLPLYEIGVSRTVPFGPMGCRFWIRPVDLTGDRKEIFRERESQLWRRFWFRW